jgi:hypothetical protein
MAVLKRCAKESAALVETVLPEMSKVVSRGRTMLEFVLDAKVWKTLSKTPEERRGEQQRVGCDE